MVFSKLVHKLLKYTTSTTYSLNINTRDAYFTNRPHSIYGSEEINPSKLNSAYGLSHKQVLNTQVNIFYAMVTKLYFKFASFECKSIYSRTSIIQTHLCHLYHKSVQISEFVRISEAHSLIYKVMIKYSNRTHTTLIEHTLGVKIL